MNNILVIGIAGGTGSGKTTLTEKLCEHFGDAITVMYHDNYYKSHSDIPLEERALLNYDHPDAFDTDLMVEDIKKLKAGETVDCPVYDYKLHTRSSETKRIVPSKVIIIEGILVLESRKLRNLMDIKIFVDTDADERILRRIQRDVEERGRSIQSVVNQYLATVKPMHNLYVEPSKKHADIVIQGGGYNAVALDMLIHRINNI
jgi:uridine kinase